MKSFVIKTPNAIARWYVCVLMDIFFGFVGCELYVESSFVVVAFVVRQADILFDLWADPLLNHKVLPQLCILTLLLACPHRVRRTTDPETCHCMRRNVKQTTTVSTHLYPK